MEKIKEIKTMIDLHERIAHLDPKTTILFFDIDNTLLRTTMDIGSVEWVKWQENMIHSGQTDHPHCLASEFVDIYQKYETWLNKSNCETELLEDYVSDLLDTYIKDGYKIVLITARNKDTWKITLNQLARHYDQSKFYCNEFLLETPKNIYRSGVFFATGMNKGKCIDFLLHLYKLTFNYIPENIVFVDDSMNECIKVSDQFVNSPMNVQIYCYRHCDKFEKIFHQIDKNDLHQKWIDFHEN